MSGREIKRLGAQRVVGVLGPMEQVRSEARLSDAALIAPLGMRAPEILQRLQQGDGPTQVRAWRDAGEALVARERPERAKIAWQRGLERIAVFREAQGERAELYWRLAVLAEGLGGWDEALAYYERAADTFGQDGSYEDEAIARMALARVALRSEGAGGAERFAGEAVTAARRCGEGAPGLLALALEEAAEVAQALGQLDEAAVRLKEAQRQWAEVRGWGGALGEEEVRVGVKLAELYLRMGEGAEALEAYEGVSAWVETHESPEVRARALGVLGLLYLEGGEAEEGHQIARKALEALENLERWLIAARLHLELARRLETLGGVDAVSLIAQEAQGRGTRYHFERAWMLAKESADRFRAAPFGYALARHHAGQGFWVEADLVITEVLESVRASADLEGLVHCTELAVRTALHLDQGALALERLVVLARARGEMGDLVGEVRGLSVALEAALTVPKLDPGPVIAEFMEGVRRVGPQAFGPDEMMERAGALAEVGRFEEARELAEMNAQEALAQGREKEAARSWVEQAVWATREQVWGEAEGAWERALEVAERLGMREREVWETELRVIREGRGG